MKKNARTKVVRIDTQFIYWTIKCIGNFKKLFELLKFCTAVKVLLKLVSVIGTIFIWNLIWIADIY